MNHEDLTKKDHTYDNEGRIMEVKQIKTDYLPSLSYHQTKVLIPQVVKTVQSEFNKKMKAKSKHVNSKVEDLSKDFNI
jgi:hypothetical protein